MNAKITKSSDSKATVIKELVGKWFFFLYAVVYGCFIFINVASPDFMGIGVGDFNIAIVFGLGLIVFAILLAFAYNHISTRAEELLDKPDDDNEGVIK